MFLSRALAIDLGTANTLVYQRGKGVVLSEPSVVARDTETGRVLAVGHEAKRMLGRTPGSIVAIRPLKEGVIADYDVTEAMLRYFLTRARLRNPIMRPTVMICVPSSVTTVEKRAVLEATLQAGAKKAALIEEPLAAALGAGLEITGPKGNMIADIGGGTTDVAVLSLGGIVVSDSVRVGGDYFDEALVRYMKREYNLLVGERTAEELKVAIGNALVTPELAGAKHEVRGRDLMTGLPRNIEMTAEEVKIALDEPVNQIVNTLRGVLERTPPELGSDISEAGLVLTGGGALLHGLAERLSMETGLPARLAPDPLTSVAVGTGIAIESYESLEDRLLVLKKVM